MTSIKNGEVVIRTLSIAERVKVASNAKFGEAGLDVSVSRKLGPRIIVQQEGDDEFMEELFRVNLREFSPEFKKTDVRMVSSWKVATDGRANVVLEGSDKLMSTLLEAGRCYVK